MKLVFTSILVSLSLITASGQEDPSSPTQSPTFTEPCYVCGEPTLFVDPSLSFDFAGSILTCSLVQSYAQSGLVSPEVCASLQPLVLVSCTCALTDPPVAAPTAPPRYPVGSAPAAPAPPTPMGSPIPPSSSPTSTVPDAPTNTPAAPTPSPSYSEYCYVCGGNPIFAVDPNLSVDFATTTFACVELEELGTNRLASALECDLFVQLVLESCNCTSNSAGGGLPTAAPTPTPVTGSPTLAPSKSTIESSGGGGSNGLYALSLFALIPFALGAFAWKRRRAQQSKRQKEENADEQENPTSGNEPSHDDNDDNIIVPPKPSSELPSYKDQVRSAARPRHAGDDDALATDASAHLMDDDAAAPDDEQLVFQAEAVATAASHLPNVKDQCRTVRQRGSDQSLMPVANAVLIDESFSRINTSSNTKADMEESI